MSTETATESDPRAGLYPTVTELLARVMADITHVGKDGFNKQQNFNFRGIDAVLNAVGPALRAHGIVPKPILKDVTYENILVGEKRTPMTRCTVKVKYRFKGPGGDHEDVTVPGEAFDAGDKGTAKAMSVAYRIALIQLLALPTTEPDPDESSYERASAAVTDQSWLAAVRQRIAAATDHDALNVIGADIGTQADAGQLGDADGNRLRAEFDARWAALAPQDRPAQRHRGAIEDEWNTTAGQPLPPIPTAPEPAPAPAGPPVRGVTEAQKKMIWGTINRQGHTHDGGHVLMSRILGREITSTDQLSIEDGSTVINALRTGEIPAAPTPEPPGPAPSDEGIAEFDALEQMIRDVHDPQTEMDCRDAIRAEHERRAITASDVELLTERLNAHVKRAQAGAST